MRSVMAATLVAVATVLVACSTGERGLFGTLSVSVDGNTCRDTEGLPVEEGTGVFVFVLTGETGEKLGTTRLTDKAETDEVCTFAFHLSGIPTNENAYAVMINERVWRLNRADLDAGAWWVDLYSIK